MKRKDAFLRRRNNFKWNMRPLFFLFLRKASILPIWLFSLNFGWFLLSGNTFKPFCYDAEKAFQNKTWKKQVVQIWKKYLQIKDLPKLWETFQDSWIPKALLNADWLVILGETQLTTINLGWNSSLNTSITKRKRSLTWQKAH